MSMTIDQSLALIQAMTKSPRVQAHLEGAVGFGRVPEAKDFDSNDQDTLERCEVLLGYLEESVGVLQASLKDRPRQPKDMLDEAESSREAS